MQNNPYGTVLILQAKMDTNSDSLQKNSTWRSFVPWPLMSEKNTFPDSLLDLAFTNIPEAVHTVSTLPPVSDHLPNFLHRYKPLIESTALEIDNQLRSGIESLTVTTEK